MSQFRPMNGDDLPNALTLEAVYCDHDLVQVEAVIRAGFWCGRARAYTDRETINAAATNFHRLANGASSTAEFTAGADTGTGLVAFRFYQFDRAGHIACHIQLASETATHHRLEEVARLSVEVRAEPWAIGLFAGQVSEMAKTLSGQAKLEINLNLP